MNYLQNLPTAEQLLEMYREPLKGAPGKVNNHIHTPYSFSAFQTIEEAVKLAVSEDVMILGINDFYVTEGYREFIEKCLRHAVFPLLNVEMIGVSKELQREGIRINDPNNPGRIYISGKGLAYPIQLPEKDRIKLEHVIRESNRQVSEMVQLLNQWLQQHETGIFMDVKEIMQVLAKGLLRERHVAKMLRIKLNEAAPDDLTYHQKLKAIYGGKDPSFPRTDVAGTEEELRARLLKAGAPAFVAEDVQAFLKVEEIIRIIRKAGGIPTYPLLLDGAGGSATEFEAGKEQLLESLQRMGFQSVEFIPLRNRFEILKEYAAYFYEQGFVVSFGTEHNTSAMKPLTVSCKEGVPLDQDLMEISLAGAAYIAGHQFLVEREGLEYHGRSRERMEQLGKAVIHHTLHFREEN